jgi:hypothetical protein
VHLSGGNEDQLLKIYDDILPCDWVFSTHRNHYHALLKGIPADDLRESIRNGWSMFVYSRDHNFLCSAVLAGTCAIAAGVAWVLKQEGRFGEVFCFIGDGGEEEGHFYEAAMFVESNQLPCRFIIEDNGRSVDTGVHVRRGAATGLEGHFNCVERYYYEPVYPHAGSGCKQHITFRPAAIDRLKRSVRLTSASEQPGVSIGADAFGRAVNRPYAGDCLDGHKDYRKYWSDPMVEIVSTSTNEPCSRPGCSKRMMTDNYCEDGHCRPVGRPLDKRDFPLGGDENP